MRTDVDLKKLTELMTLRRTPKEHLLMGNRITFSGAAERYMKSDAWQATPNSTPTIPVA